MAEWPSRMVNAREAVESAIVAATVAVHRDDINIQRFWMTLHDQGFEVVGRPIKPALTDGADDAAP